LSASTALAEAPQCDARGAITFAKPPRLEERNATSIDAEAAPSCLDILLSNEAYEHGRAPQVEPSSSYDALPSAYVARLPEVWRDAPAPALVEIFVSRSERDRLERPPRA
jgi:hypothetical protein